MASAGAVGVLGVAVLAIGGAGWLLFQGSGGSGGGDQEAVAEHATHASDTERASLTGRDPSRAAAPVETVDGEFTIPGKVLDEKGKPVADVTVSVRRTGEAYREGDSKRWAWNGSDQLKRSFEDLGAVKPDAAPAATAKSAADGTFQLPVRRFGDYTVRAEPAAPAVGTSATWYLNDAPPNRPLTLRVLPGSALKGRVVDAQDRGVDAVVNAMWFETGMGMWTHPNVATGAGGRFEFPAVPNGKVNLGVGVAGRLSLTGRAVTTPTTEEVVIRLGDSATLLKGRVKDLQGEPLAGARVQVALQAVTATPASTEALLVTYFATSDAEGQYAMSGPLGGTVSQVQATAPGYLYASQAPPLAPWSGLELAVGREAELDLVLWKGGVLEGRVTEKGSGVPLAGVEVQVHPSALDARITTQRMLTATTDAQGHYRVDGVPIGRNIVLPRHPAYFLPALEALPNLGGDIMYYTESVPNGPPPALFVFIEKEGQRVEKNVELAKGLPCSGRVVDAAGAPVAGAEVTAPALGLGQYQWQWGLQGGQEVKPLATSDAEGKFTVEGLPPRRSWVLVAKKKPLLGEPSQPFELSATATAPPEIVLKLMLGATLAGRVVDERGTGIPDVQVMAWSQSGGNYQQNPSVQTGEDGAFRMEGVPAGSVTLNAWGVGRNSGQQVVEGLTAGDVREGLELKMASGAELSGIATDENGAPARFKSLIAMSLQHGQQSQTQTGADGSFKFSDMQAGTIRISAGTWENSVELAQAQAPSSGVRVTWKEPPIQVIEGTVLDAQGKPVPLCQLSIRPKSSGNPSTGMMVPLPAGYGGAAGAVVNGWFRRNASGKPPFVVDVSGPQDANGRPMNLRGKTVNDVDPKAGPLTITLEPGIQVAGQVLDPAGKGVENVGVSVGNVRSASDAEGGFTLGGLTEGEVQLIVVPPAPWVRPQPARVTAGTTDLVVRLRAGLPIAGIVRGDGGKLPGSGYVQVSWKATNQSPDGNLGGQVKSDGRFRVEGVPEEASATVTVQMWSLQGQQQFAPKTFNAVRPGTEDLVVDLTGGLTVEGIVVDASGKPFAQAWVMVATITEPAQNPNYAPIQPDGTFRVAGLAPGTVSLTLQRHDGGPVPEALRVDLPATGVKIVLPQGSPVRGTLVGAGSVVWRLWAWSTGESKKMARVTYGGDGKFALESASPGTHWMIGARTRSNDDDRYALGGPYAAGTENVSLELKTGRSIEGTVVNSDGTEVPTGTWVRAGNDTWSAQAQTGSKGEFRLRGLPPGRYRVTAGTPQNDQVASQDDVDDGASGLRLTLRANSG